MITTIEEHIKQTAGDNIVSVIEDYITLRRCGKDYTGLCPFHNDEHEGNFKVSPSRRVWSCFAEGISGDAIAFVMRMEKTDYLTALKMMADKFGIDTEDTSVRVQYKPVKVQPVVKPICYIPDECVSRQESTDSVLIDYLKSFIDADVVESVCKEYRIGRTKDRWTIFSQIDIDGRVRYMKKMEYLPNGHRNKDNEDSIKGLHFELKTRGVLPKDWSQTECLFGEHLLNKVENKSKVAALVESEKSAIVGAMLQPEFIWLAVGGKGRYNNPSLMKVLANRTVVAFPDADAFDVWNKATEGLKSANIGLSRLICSRWLEDHITDEQRAAKVDIADLLIEDRIKAISEPQQEAKTDNAPAECMPIELRWRYIAMCKQIFLTNTEMLKTDFIRDAEVLYTWWRNDKAADTIDKIKSIGIMTEHEDKLVFHIDKC